MLKGKGSKPGVQPPHTHTHTQTFVFIVGNILAHKVHKHIVWKIVQNAVLLCFCFGPCTQDQRTSILTCTVVAWQVRTFLDFPFLIKKGH